MSINGVTGVNNTEYPEYAEYAKAQATASGESVDFSAMLANALRDEASRASVTAGAGPGMMAGGFMPMQMQSQGIEELILAAASSGEVSDAQAALFMLCMMMQTSTEGDFSMIMQMMATMINQIQDDAGTLRGSVMASGYDPYILDTIDWNVFGTRFPGPAGVGIVELPLEFWRPTTPVVTSNEDDRSPERYTSVINQFRVETAARYRPGRDGFTYCNIYVWDVTTAMGAELPHYTDPHTGEPRYYPDIKGAKSMLAREVDKWLKTYGPTYGWRQVDAETAQMHANEGRPAVASGGTLDHISMVCPSKDRGFDPVRGVTIAQAGGKVSSYMYISGVYGANALANQITYWVHD